MKLRILNPATAALLTEVDADDAASIQAKFARARAAQPQWARTPLAQRLASIEKFRDLLAENRERLAKTLTSEVGKPITQARNELNAMPARLDFFLQNTARVIQDETVVTRPAQHLEERISHEPLGVIGNISAWNYPYFVGSNVFIPALLTGNAVLYKPSEFATLTGLAITELLHRAGIPADIFIPIIGGAAAGTALLQQPLNGVFFTGSYATGQKIAQAVASRLIKLQLELGGKDPAYVCDDVDVAQTAAALADGAFYNTGQSCCAVERIYVHTAVYETFVAAFVETVKGFAVGDPFDDKTYIGPLARAAQLAVLDAQVADAKAKGARLLCGGGRLPGPGFFFAPTVFTDTDHSMTLMREESFGPLIGIQRVRDDAHALELMNDTDYGLTASIYTQDAQRASELLAQVNAGTVYWNCCDRVSPHLPWSGRGNSGVGCTLSTYGIQTFVQPKAWHLKQR